MAWIDHMNEAVDYIENHLTDNISIEKTANIACCSTFHFQRMFAYIAGVPLSAYIRQRRMSLAAADLQNGNKIIDVAEKYCYDSPTSFNRAFKSVHGFAPSQLKHHGTTVKAFPKIRFTVNVSAGAELLYRIEKKDAIRIAGIYQELESDLEKNFATVPKMWMKAALLGTVKRIAALQDNNTVPGILGVSFETEKDKWQYYIASATNRTDCGKFSTIEIPAATWAIFTGQGPSKTIQDLERRIITEWLPTSGYEYANAPDVEVYLNPDPNNAKYEVWIPVIKAREKA